MTGEPTIIKLMKWEATLPSHFHTLQTDKKICACFELIDTMIVCYLHLISPYTGAKLRKQKHIYANVLATVNFTCKDGKQAQQCQQASELEFSFRTHWH